jgi:hypothetical protein
MNLLRSPKARFTGLMAPISNPLTFPAFLSCGLFFVVNCTAATLALPDSTIFGLTHTFGHYGAGGPATLIKDGAGAGQFTQPNFTTMLTGSETVVMRFEAPAGEKFVIHAPPSGYDGISLSLVGSWWVGSGDGLLNPIATSFAFENLVGSTPVHTYSFDTLGAGGRVISFSDAFTISPAIEFTAVELRATYAFSIANPSTHLYVPVPDSFKFVCAATSYTQILGDGTLMTLETVPEPTSLALVFVGATALLRRHLKRNRTGS